MPTTSSLDVGIGGAGFITAADELDAMAEVNYRNRSQFEPRGRRGRVEIRRQLRAPATAGKRISKHASNCCGWADGTVKLG